jgi:Copper type II ascorbate-dependent monooxygenase, C-terminal domain
VTRILTLLARGTARVVLVALAACGDGDALPNAHDDETRDKAQADPNHDEPSDEESGEDSERIQVEQDVADGARDARDDGGEGGSATAGVDGSVDAREQDVDASSARADSSVPAVDSAVDAGGMDAADSSPDLDARMDDAQRPDTGTSLTYFRDAKPIIDAKCKPCHFAGGIGPFPLTKYDEVKPYAPLISYDVSHGEMPPWQASGPLGVYVGDRRLSDVQKSTLLRWVEEGALEGDPSQAPPEVVPPDRRGLGRVDLSLPIGGSYTPQTFPDEYRCFVLEWPYAQTRYITGISIEPSRRQSVHHAILYMEPPENAASVRSQDRGAAGLGFPCFSNVNSLTTWLSSYEPGGYGQSFPDGLGFEVKPGSLLVLQVHYNSLNGTGPDASRVDLELADRVPHVATVQQLIDPLWVLGFMPIAANQSDVVHRWRGRPSGLGTFTTYDVHWVDLHMHTLGSRGSVSIARANRTVEPLLTIPDWDFNWQQTYVFNRPVKLNPGDELEVECHFDNTAQNQMIVDGQRLSPRDVNWGEGTRDEMCLGNVLVTPAM